MIAMARAQTQNPPSKGKVLAAFTEDQVVRLTGLGKSRLRYWDRTGFFKPSLAHANRRVAFSRIYSFRDVVALRTLKVIRHQYNVSLQHLRHVAEKMRSSHDNFWISTTLYVLNRRVHFVNPDDPASEKIEDVLNGQYALGIPLRVIAEDTSRDVRELASRRAEEAGRIQRARSVRHNAWVIAGTRISVDTIKRFAQDGFSVSEINQQYPSLTPEDIKAAIAHQGDLAA